MNFSIYFLVIIFSIVIYTQFGSSSKVKELESDEDLFDNPGVNRRNNKGQLDNINNGMNTDVTVTVKYCIS